MTDKYDIAVSASGICLTVITPRGGMMAEFAPEEIPELCADLMQAMADVKEIRSVELEPVR